MNYHYFDLVLNFLSAISWPIVCLIIASFFKKPISIFLKRVKKISYGDAVFESGRKKQKDDKSEIDLATKGDDFSSIDQTISKFSDVGQKYALEIVEAETKISEIVDSQLKYERLLKYSQLLLMIKFFERTYRLIYGSQIRLLHKLNYSPEKSQDVKYLYDNAANYFPETYKDYPYEDYLKFLVTEGLITKDENEGILSITDVGKDFLRYLVESNSSLEKLY